MSVFSVDQSHTTVGCAMALQSATLEFTQIGFNAWSTRAVTWL